MLAPKPSTTITERCFMLRAALRNLRIRLPSLGAGDATHMVGYDGGEHQDMNSRTTAPGGVEMAAGAAEAPLLPADYSKALLEDLVAYADEQYGAGLALPRPSEI